MNDLDDLSSWLALTRQATLQLEPKASVYEAFWEKGARSDGRVFSEARRYTVQHGILTSAAGSALVSIKSTNNNATVVLAAVTLQVGQPAAVAPNQGDIVVQVTPNGPVGATTNMPRVQSFLQRLVEENVDLEQLVIVEGKMAYRLTVAVTLFDISGSVLDACIAAISAALLDTRLPSQPIIEDGVVYTAREPEEYKPLYMPIVPCSLTAAGARFCKDGASDATIQHHWIVDPDATEESVQESLVTVVVNAAAKDEVLSIEFSATSDASQGIETTELARMIHMATGHATDLASILQRSSA